MRKVLLEVRGLELCCAELGGGGGGDGMVESSVGLFGVACVCGLEVCDKYHRRLEDAC